jgi:hypothetical protein
MYSNVNSESEQAIGPNSYSVQASEYQGDLGVDGVIILCGS